MFGLLGPPADTFRRRLVFFVKFWIALFSCLIVYRLFCLGESFFVSCEEESVDEVQFFFKFW